MHGTSASEFKWYVVRAITGQEKKVKAMIESELDLKSLRNMFHKS